MKNTRFVRILGKYKSRWYLKPVCWLFGHKKKWTSAYGIRYKQCSRCGKDFFNKKINEMERKLYFGEWTELSGVRFVTTKRGKKVDK